MRLDRFHADAVLATGTAAADEPVLAADEIQGNVLPGFGTKFVSLLGLTIDDIAAARSWLRALAPRISTLRHVNDIREVRRAVARATGTRPDQPDVLLNVVLSCNACRTLGLDVANVERLFDVGMARATLDDPVDDLGVPLGWVIGATPDTTPDVLLLLGSDAAPAVVAALQAIESDLKGGHQGLRITYRENGGRLAGDVEHFGFRDGISQPGVRGRLSARLDHVLTRRYFDAADPRATTDARPGQPLIWPGQFVFGLPTQIDDPTRSGPIATPPSGWMANGSYMVFRRLRQDVAAFRSFASDMAPVVSTRLGRTIGVDELQALIVGRWQDGTPLMRSPAGPNPAISDDDDAINFFTFHASSADARVVGDGGTRVIPGVADDVRGDRCPHFAHIRKVNVRDRTDQGPMPRFRLLRRGIPYGPPFTEGEVAGIDRGLLFMSYGRSINPQFTTVVAAWMDSASAPEGLGHDILVGQNAQPRFAEVTSGNGAPTRLFDVPPERVWVRPTGGGFFFSPAVSVFQSL